MCVEGIDLVCRHPNAINRLLLLLFANGKPDTSCLPRECAWLCILNTCAAQHNYK